MDTIEGIFTVGNWDAGSIDDARRSLVGAIAKAAEVGLLYVLQTTRRVTGIVEDEDPAEWTEDGRMTSSTVMPCQDLAYPSLQRAVS
jgi:hypothetical protein